MPEQDEQQIARKSGIVYAAVFSLADFDYDFGALWASQSRQEELSAIDEGRACWCTHVCFIHDSMRHSRRALLYDLPKNFLTRERW